MLVLKVASVPGAEVLQQIGSTKIGLTLAVGLGARKEGINSITPDRQACSVRVAHLSDKDCWILKTLCSCYSNRHVINMSIWRAIHVSNMFHTSLLQILWYLWTMGDRATSVATNPHLLRLFLFVIPYLWICLQNHQVNPRLRLRIAKTFLWILVH